MLKDKLDLRARAGGVKVFPAEEARCAKAWGQGFFLEKVWKTPGATVPGRDEGKAKEQVGVRL